MRAAYALVGAVLLVITPAAALADYDETEDLMRRFTGFGSVDECVKDMPADFCKERWRYARKLAAELKESREESAAHTRDAMLQERVRDEETARQKAELERSEQRAFDCRWITHPVRIGMTAKALRASCWGEPYSISRLTTARGTTEQWQYHDVNLYFYDGILTAIQQ